jgi:SpoIID/LytB domain protein
MGKEPIISVGLMITDPPLEFRLNGAFEGNESVSLSSGKFRVRLDGDRISLLTKNGTVLLSGRTLNLLPKQPGESCFCIKNVPVGTGFHWEGRQDLMFHGEFHFRSRDGRKLEVINRLPLEIYLPSVIGSEMSGSAPFEFLKAHSVISRSWAMRGIERKNREPLARSSTAEPSGEEAIIRWTGTEIHKGFDVCADDHCQRYRGFHEERALDIERAVQETRGQVLTYGDELCDTRYSKCCGGMTENFSTAWEDKSVPYLKAVPDSDRTITGFLFPLSEEKNAHAWITGVPQTNCSTRDRELVESVLSPLDRETTDFYRWRTEYSQEEISKVITEKTGRDPGSIRDLIPLERGASGRVIRLRILGTARTLTVGKELEIRRVLSSTHLYSSAFVIKRKPGEDGIPRAFQLLGAGWGHGVGLCQVGAAVMTASGKTYEEILRHYFPDTILTWVY